MSALNSLKSSEPGCFISIIVNKDDLAKAYATARYVSGCLHRIENLSELDWEEMTYLCRSIHQAEILLQKMLDAENNQFTPLSRAAD